MDSVADSALAEVRRLVLDGLGDHRVRVFLFGSRATGRPREGSDIDVAVLPLDSLPAEVLAGIRDALEESTVPYRVDLVDLRHASDNLREQILREGVSWTD